MLGENILFKQEPLLTINSDKIIITGHFNDTARCAKLTMLCEMYGAKINNGYAELPYDKKFLEDYKKYINEDLKFVAITGSAIAILIASLIAAAGATAGGQWGTSKATIRRNNELKTDLRSKFPELSEAQIDALVAQYGDVGSGLFDPGHWGDQTDYTAIDNLMKELEAAYNDIGEQPNAPTDAELNKIMEDAYAEVDAENTRLLNLYKDSLLDTKGALQEEIANNNAMFADYRNQVLTNNAMQQQAIAGSTRYELDRQQRNAISRGASAAQRLVSNINTSLGLQAQSAQQALNTSNVLAQSLLNHRQAQQGARDAYLNSKNAYNSQLANTMAGQAERKLSYGRAKRQDAIDKYNYAYDTWNDRVNNYFQGNSLGAGIYRSRYGSGGRNNSDVI